MVPSPGLSCVTHFLTFLQVFMQNIIRPNERRKSVNDASDSPLKLRFVLRFTSFFIPIFFGFEKAKKVLKVVKRKTKLSSF